MFLIMFKTGHALPLAGARLLRPRSNRGEHGEQPCGVCGSWPRARQIRDLDSAENRTRTQTVPCPRTIHVRVQSAQTGTATNRTRFRKRSGLDSPRTGNGHRFNLSADSPQPWIVHARKLVTGAICLRTWTGNEFSAPLHRRVHLAADQFPGSYPLYSSL